MFYGSVFWFSPDSCLDEEFDASDIGADAEFCRAIAAGRYGMHPDAWGNYDPLSLKWSLRKRDRPEPEAYAPPVSRKWKDDAKWEAERRRPPKPKQTAWTWVLTATPAVDNPYGGTIELTCDDCRVRFKILTTYDHGQRARRAAGLRALGAKKGWTHIVGRDRCPACSSIAAPDDIGEGAGERERDEQHADGG